jgi:hypothetical protein
MGIVGNFPTYTPLKLQGEFPPICSGNLRMCGDDPPLSMSSKHLQLRIGITLHL